MAAFVFRLWLEELILESCRMPPTTSPLVGEVDARSAAGEGEAP